MEQLESRRGEVTPIYAHGFFTLSATGEVTEVLVFDYYDEEHFYSDLLHDQDRFRDEVDTLRNGMQEVLDQEEVRMNGDPVEKRVLATNIDLRGAEEIPSVVFHIRFQGRLELGRNLYENEYEEGRAEYDYDAYWTLPSNSKVLDVESSTRHQVMRENLIVMWARTGDPYGGRESILFELS